MKIGIIGTRNMGRALGLGWACVGHEVLFGSRDLNKAKAIAVKGTASTQAGDFEAAAEFDEVALYTIRDRFPSSVLKDRKCSPVGFSLIATTAPYWDSTSPIPISAPAFTSRSRFLHTPNGSQPTCQGREWSKPLTQWRLKLSNWTTTNWRAVASLSFCAPMTRRRNQS